LDAAPVAGATSSVARARARRRHPSIARFRHRFDSFRFASPARDRALDAMNAMNASSSSARRTRWTRAPIGVAL
jgi:hypothetical protein